MRIWLLPVVTFLATTSLSACGGCNTSGQEPLAYTAGLVSPDHTMYESTRPGGDMLHFPPGRMYLLAHGLGTDHIEISPYVSFVKKLTPGASGNDPFAPNHLSVAAGNEAVVEGWDEKYIRIRNDTCAEFYLYVVASTAQAYAGAGGAGGAAAR